MSANKFAKTLALSTDLLLELQATVKEELDSRMDTRLGRGREGTFVCKSGITRHMVIDKVNPTTVSCTELSDSHNPGAKWKVAHALFRVTPIRREKSTLAGEVKRSAIPVTTPTGEVW
jgi:hypothetical protein